MRHFRVGGEVLVASRVAHAVFVVTCVVSVGRQRHVHTVAVAALRALRCPRKVHCTVITDVIDILNGHVVRTIRFADGTD